MKSIVKTKYGLIQGTEKDSYMEFLGIPYAKPPIGDLRWRETEEPEPWDGVYQATAFGAPALQAECQSIPGGDPAERGVFQNDSEDCLYLNIWTPAKTENDRLPVFIWIHGGAFCCGSGAGKAASPVPFCSRGILYVTFNYRLGLMGYFTHPELSKESKHGVSGNYAHFDQIAAVRWVKENIASFGGDPENITLGGCSAGCGSIQVLCNSPLAKGLFQRAILESTVALEGGMYPEKFKLEKLSDMEKRGVEYMERVNCQSIEEMRKLSYQELIDFEDCHFLKKYHFGTTMNVNADGYLLSEHYRYGMTKLSNANIPYIVGNTHDESGEHVYLKSMEEFHEKNKAVFEEDTDRYEELCGIKSLEDVPQCLRDTHLLLARSKVFAERSGAAGRQPVYVYDFKRKDPGCGLAIHGLETHYLMGTVANISGTTEEDLQLAETMQDYWCNFIRTGDPNAEGLPQWTPYTAENRNVLYLDCPEVTVGEDSECEHPLLAFTREFLADKLEKNDKK